TIPARKNPAGSRIAAQINAKETDGRSSKRSTFRAVKPAAMFMRASSVPCAWASVNMSRRVSFPTSRYQPILKPCKVSSAPPSDRKIRSDHQPNRKFRSAFFLMVRTRGVGRLILPGESACRRARFEGVGKYLVANVHSNRAASQDDKLRWDCALRATIFHKPAQPLRSARNQSQHS